MSRRSALFASPTIETRSHIFRRAWNAVEPDIYYLPGSSETVPEFRAFVDANRPAVELIIKGTEQVDGISGPVGEPLPEENDSDLARAYPLRASRAWMIGMMVTEGTLREERGDMAGAWDCYRAVLRMTVHVRRRERLNDRMLVTLWLPAVRKRLATWAADPRTTIHQVQLRPGGGRRVPAQARVGCVHTQDRVSGPHAISEPARRSPSRTDRGGVDLSSG